MKTIAELEAERDRIQAMIDKGEYLKAGIEVELDRRITAWTHEQGGRSEFIADFIAIARRHLLPIVTAGEAKEGEMGLVWNGRRWFAAAFSGGIFSTPGGFGQTDESTELTHWLPAARVPGPGEGGK